jgi:hypothetical protein
MNNLKMADVKSIGVMKLEVMSRRSVFRDYYDIYSILKSGISLAEIIAETGKYTFHNLRTRDMISLLINTEYVTADKNFHEKSNPAYQVTLDDIRNFLVTQAKELINK